MTPSQPGDTLGARLLDKALNGRRQRLYGLLAAELTRRLEDVAATAAESTQVGVYLALLAAVQQTTGHERLAWQAARELARRLTVSGPLEGWRRPEPGEVFCCTQRYQSELRLPRSLAGCDQARISSEFAALTHQLAGQPNELWQLTFLSSLRPARPRRGGVLLVVPPRTTLPAAPGAERPAPGGFPVELAAACPPAMQVLDARAERLWFDEALAAIAAHRPAGVALVLDRHEDRRPFEQLATEVRQLLPQTRLVAVAGVGQAVGDGFEVVVVGPPFGALALAGSESGGDLPPVAAADDGDLTAWPVACYRRELTDPDVWLPTSGRDGAALAARLVTAAAQVPSARLSWAEPLSPAQAAALLDALPRPAPPEWWLPLTSATLPAELAALRTAGLRLVVVHVGAQAVPLPQVATLVAALRSAQLQVWARVDLTGLDPARALAELHAAAPERASWHGPDAAAVSAAWAELSSR